MEIFNNLMANHGSINFVHKVVHIVLSAGIIWNSVDSCRREWRMREHYYMRMTFLLSGNM